MIDKKEAEISKYKLGLVLKTILDNNKAIAEENKAKGIKDINLITSFSKLESNTGLRKATVIDIVTAKSNAEFSSIVAILTALSISLTDFGKLYDSTSESETAAYKLEILKSRKGRNSQKA